MVAGDSNQNHGIRTIINPSCVNWALHLQRWLKEFNNLGVFPFLGPVYCCPVKRLHQHTHESDYTSRVDLHNRTTLISTKLFPKSFFITWLKHKAEKQFHYQPFFGSLMCGLAPKFNNCSTTPEQPRPDATIRAVAWVSECW